MVVIMLALNVSSAEEKDKGGGLFSEGSFLSEAISSVTDKIGKVTSGEEKIVDDNAKGVDKDILSYDAERFGRSRSALNNDDYRNYRKRVMQEQEQKNGVVSGDGTH